MNIIPEARHAHYIWYLQLYSIISDVIRSIFGETRVFFLAFCVVTFLIVCLCYVIMANVSRLFINDWPFCFL